MAKWTQEELEALEDPEQWDWHEADMQPGVADASVVAKVRISAAEYRHLARAARRADQNTLHFIRTAALGRAAEMLPDAAAAAPTRATDG